MVLLHAKDPFELFLKRKEFFPNSWFLSRCDMSQTVESDVKTHFFPPFFLHLIFTTLPL